MRRKSFPDRFTTSNTNLLEDCSFPLFLRLPVGRDFRSAYWCPFDSWGTRQRDKVIHTQPSLSLAARISNLPKSSAKAEAAVVSLANKKNVLGNGMLRINFVLIKKKGVATEFLGADFAVIVGDFKEKRRNLRMNYYPNF